MRIKKTNLNCLVDWRTYVDEHKENDEMFIGYLTISQMENLNMKTVRYLDNPNDKRDKLYELGWFPTFVKIWEWAKNNSFYNPKRYELSSKPKRHKL